ncbi:Uncharacterised protein [Enterobacter ludwigii]|nr:Uncharacterised protein [Enterobacter ludwigii]
MSAERWQRLHLSLLKFHALQKSRASITSGRRVRHSLKPGKGSADETHKIRNDRKSISLADTDKRVRTTDKPRAVMKMEKIHLEFIVTDLILLKDGIKQCIRYTVVYH